MTYKDEAKASHSAKVARMLGKQSDNDQSVEASEGVKTVTAKGDVAPSKSSDDGKKVTPRNDRPARARGGAVKNKGKTTVNVIVAPQGGGQPPAVSASSGPPPMPPSAPPPSAAPVPAVPPRPPMPAPGGAAMPMPMRKRGGAVKLTAGSGSGLGRLEKEKAY